MSEKPKLDRIKWIVKHPEITKRRSEHNGKRKKQGQRLPLRLRNTLPLRDHDTNPDGEQRHDQNGVGLEFNVGRYRRRRDG